MAQGAGLSGSLVGFSSRCLYSLCGSRRGNGEADHEGIPRNPRAVQARVGDSREFVFTSGPAHREELARLGTSDGIGCFIDGLYYMPVEDEDDATYLARSRGGSDGQVA